MAYNAISNPGTRWAVIAPTFGDARDTCVEGESGLKAVLDRYRMVRRWNRSHGELDLINGSKIKCFSADEPERLRGPQHHGAWCDELAAWRYEDAWDQLKFGLRLGENPQTLVTTTPKPNKLTKRVLKNPSTIVTRGSTFDNAANLSPAALEEFRLRYEGTRLGRQELYGELLEDVEGALFTLKMIEETRVGSEPESPERTVVAVDPAVTYGPDSDETGIVTMSRKDGHLYCLKDSTLKASPDEWAKAVVAEYHRAKADMVVIETNNGGDMALSVLRTVDPYVPVKKVTASKGKHTRAEPIAALMEQGKLHHAGVFPELEQQLTEWVPGDSSPDRLDAYVWAATSLMTRPVAAIQTFAT
jgi:phage terminase large subunit-like protein